MLEKIDVILNEVEEKYFLKNDLEVSEKTINRLLRAIEKGELPKNKKLLEILEKLDEGGLL